MFLKAWIFATQSSIQKSAVCCSREEILSSINYFLIEKTVVSQVLKDFIFNWKQHYKLLFVADNIYNVYINLLGTGSVLSDSLHMLSLYRFEHQYPYLD